MNRMKHMYILFAVINPINYSENKYGFINTESCLYSF